MDQNQNLDLSYIHVHVSHHKNVFKKIILAWDYEKNHWHGRHMGGEERNREDKEGEKNYMCTEMTSKGVGQSTALLIFVTPLTALVFQNH